MRSRSSLWLIGAVGLSACLQILGDDYSITHHSGQGAASSTSSGGGQGGATSTSSGGGQAPCALGALGVCGDGMKCTVVDVATGQIGCAPAGPRPGFARCENDSNCADGTWCDLPARVCLPICTVDADCSNGGTCVVPGDENNGPIANLKVCFANCNPISGKPCEQGFGPVACIVGSQPNADAVSSCWQGGGVLVGQPCSNPEDCAVGSMCDNLQCVAWCTPLGVAPQCEPSVQCIDVGISIGGTVYGLCAG